jgi:two-component system response regulator YesN
LYKVLLVDDEPLALEGLELLIDWNKRGFRVEAACENGEEALRHIRRNPPDLVVTDIRMPVLDGLGLIEEARKSGESSPLFVVASGYADFEYARRALRLGVSHYLTKPVIGEEADEMLVRLHRELSERDRNRRIGRSARRHEIGLALSALLHGTDEQERSAAASRLSAISGAAEAWVYLRVAADGEDAAQARAAAWREAEEIDGCYPVDDGRSAFGFVAGIRYGAGRESDAIVRSLSERLLQVMRAAASGRCGIAAGCVVDRLESLPESGRSAEEAEKFLYYADSGIVLYGEIRNKELSMNPALLRAADGIVDAMENGDPESLKTVIREAFRNFETNMIEPEWIDIFLCQVIVRCASVYRDLGGDMDALLRESGFERGFPRTGHLEQAARILTEFGLRCQSAVSGMRELRTGGTQAKVADYLRRHFREPVTIKEIADRFFIHPVYLGQSFTRRYGKGVLDFLHDLRIEEAKRLLRETDEPSGAIAERVGYSTYPHFLKQFERRTGMKPGEYRQLGTAGRLSE